MIEKPPPSGRLFQEDLLAEPFWMLVACSLVNLTHWRQAQPVFLEIRERWPELDRLCLADPEELEELLRPLGLYRRRAASLKALACAYRERPPVTRLDVMKLPGCGRYASDSWAIFVEGDEDLKVSDGKLLWYLRQLRHRRNHT